MEAHAKAVGTERSVVCVALRCTWVRGLLPCDVRESESEGFWRVLLIIIEDSSFIIGDGEGQ